ncbi:MAG: TetR/AcrR family transcriptional regulator [Chloroflexota bacterium]|nr:TetR/AcrR family transcriptional regulator [Chloroflexota bacterium]
MEQEANSEARERVLEAAARLFGQRGYTVVTLRDIAAEVGIRHTSLYHHAPGGKEDLFVEVTERSLKRHRDGLNQAMNSAGPHIRAQLCAAAGWLLSQPPMDLIRMVYTDMPAINPAQAGRLSLMAYESMLLPIQNALDGARARGEIGHNNLGLVAGGLMGMVESIHSVPSYAVTTTRAEMACDLIDVMLDGLRVRA